ncbi:single-stranded-DNA-specific exonuclease RecJ [Ningiella sp. W23]|uniref:single-stranded-DNA-specific exonuclease RecJ n=1 Tax=Ningiella sp. W23 TaxID=3023715 RepID=UPI0037571873
MADNVLLKNRIKRRHARTEIVLDKSLPPIFDKILRQRGLDNIGDISTKASDLLHYQDLKDIDIATAVITEAIVKQQTICIVGDFDADGATSTALCMLCLKDFGHAPEKTQFIVPNRFDFGYGLTEPVVDMAANQGAELIVTVDNGISSLHGVAAAKAKNIKVVVTDHHLAGEHLPNADAIVNPNQPGCKFASKNLAGVGVAFYLMSAVKTHLLQNGYFEAKGLPVPNLAQYLDIVALGTVADVVPLDKNNRILVHQGLQRIRAKKTRPGILALLQVANREASRLASSDMGFVLGPRLNAAGRLEDMSVGIHCLLCEDSYEAQRFAAQLDELNRQRRSIESEMQELAEAALSKVSLSSSAESEPDTPAGIVLYDESFHQGVVGIVAGRIKEKYNTPTVAFANESESMLKGSARSIAGVHIRDVFEAIHRQFPELIAKFGGHAMAAGLSLSKANLAQFITAFENEVARVSAALPNAQVLLSDGQLPAENIDIDTASLFKLKIPWGQHFEEPLFDDEFSLIEHRIVGQKHLKMVVQKQGQLFDAIAFNVDTSLWPNNHIMRVHLAYRLDINEYRGQVSVQLLVQDLSPA